jgi:hypothetical protein
MSDQIDTRRRKLLGATAVGLAVAQFGGIAAARSQSAAQTSATAVGGPHPVGHFETDQGRSPRC